MGLSRAGFQILGAVDSWKLATESYALNFDHPVMTKDIHGLSGSQLLEELGLQGVDLDLLAGGPPCQGFSVQRIGDDYDERNNLTLLFARLVKEIAPKMFLMENVPGLLGKRGKRLAAQLEREFTSAGFGFTSAVLNAVDFGVPQMRRRVFYCGWREEDLPPFEFPEPHPESVRQTVWTSIGDLPEPPADHTPHSKDSLHRRTKLSPLNVERLRLIPPGGGMKDLPPEMRVDCHKDGPSRIGHRYVYGRLDPEQPSSTITARFDSFTRGKFGHPYQDRSISLREGARLQTFPDCFRFTGGQEDIAALIGNAVPPLLGEVLGSAIRDHLATPEARSGPSRQMGLFA